jgi:hypothetical protein
LLRWENTASTALKFNKVGGGFRATPVPQSSLLYRSAQVSLGADGDLSGEITVKFNGEDALQHRLDAIDQDEAGRRKSMEDEVRAWLPPDSVAKLQDSQGWESADEPLVAHFKITIHGFASVAGKRLLLPSYFFPTLQRNMFASQYRRYPIAFSYPFTEEDELIMKLPDDYEVEEPPFRRKAGLSYAGYEISSAVADHQITTQRKLRFEEVQLPADKYEELKNFFSVVQKGDEGHTVLHIKTEEKAQSSN